MNVSQLKTKNRNPRKISPDQIDKLKASITEFPKMMELRPIIYNPETMEVLGGNQRLAAIKALGMKEIPDAWARPATDLTDAEKQRFVVQDNHQSGGWDFDILAVDYGAELLEEIGIELPNFEQEIPEIETKNPYSQKITAPIYEITGEKPTETQLFQDDKYKQLINEIDAANISEAEKAFLRIAAQRHVVFNYDKIAEYYAHGTPELQNLMEKSALVIIDFNKAIELGYVKLTKGIATLFGEAYSDDEA